MKWRVDRLASVGVNAGETMVVFVEGGEPSLVPLGSEGDQHRHNTGCMTMAVHHPLGCSVLYFLKLVGVARGVWAPERTGIFKYSVNHLLACCP